VPKSYELGKERSDCKRNEEFLDYMSYYSSEGALCFVEWRKVPWLLCIPTSVKLNILRFAHTVSFKYDFSMITKTLYFQSRQKTSSFRLLFFFSLCQKFSGGTKGCY